MVPVGGFGGDSPQGLDRFGYGEYFRWICAQGERVAEEGSQVPEHFPGPFFRPAFFAENGHDSVVFPPDIPDALSALALFA